MVLSATLAHKVLLVAKATLATLAVWVLLVAEDLPAHRVIRVSNPAETDPEAMIFDLYLPIVE